MSAGKLNLLIEKGATFAKHLEWKTGDPPVAVNLTGYTAKMEIRDQATDTLLVDLASDGDGIEITAVTGEIDLSISAGETALIAGEAAAKYDLLLINGTFVTRLLEGEVKISPQVTVWQP